MDSEDLPRNRKCRLKCFGILSFTKSGEMIVLEQRRYPSRALSIGVGIMSFGTKMVPLGW